MPSPYIPNTEADRYAMLQAIGVSSIEDLFKDIPEKFRKAQFKLPPQLSEIELKNELAKIAKLNANLEDYACFLGGGFYKHYIPSVIGHVTGRSEFYTAYTPYQAEASQGTLQTIYEYQSLVCQLTGMEVSNAGMYDGATAAAEAVLMAIRITKKNKVALLSTISPKYQKVIETYIGGHDISFEKVEPGFTSLPVDCACLLVQQPNFFGYMENVADMVKKAHDAGALFVMCVNPISLGMFKKPGEYGIDIAVAEGQPLGNPICFGGPALGLFACRKDYMRQMPGRIVGKTQDIEGKPGYVLTMSTREQHIRRERATSNICTNEALVALAACVYLATVGKTGLRQIAELCYHKAHYAAEQISKLKGFLLAFPNKAFFNEFAVKCPAAPAKINEALFKNGVIGGMDISQHIPGTMLLCATEVNTKQQIDKLVQVLGTFQGVEQ